MAAVRLSTTLIVVIAVSGLVGCLVFLFLIFRCCRRPESAPLPPIQPLAHHREKESNYLPHSHTFQNSLGPNPLGNYESDTSLLRQSRKPSFQTGISDRTPSSSNHSFSTHSPQTNITSQSTPQLAEDEQAFSTQQYVPTTRQALSASRRPRSRVISVASTNTIFTQVSPRPTSIIRGAPHSVFSNVQIVLPAPLAPKLQSHSTTNPLAETYSNFDLDPSMQDLSYGRRTRSSSQHRSHRSSDTRDQPNPSESQALFRGRNISERSIQSKFRSDGDTMPPVPSLGDQNQPSDVASQDLRNGQGNFVAA